MTPSTDDFGDLVRRALLRAFARPPGVRIERVSGCDVLLVVATSNIRCRLYGLPVAQVERGLFIHDRGDRIVRHRVGGAFVAAIYAEDGTAVRSGRQHYLIADGALVPIDRRAYRFLLRSRPANTEVEAAVASSFSTRASRGERPARSGARFYSNSSEVRVDRCKGAL